MHKGAGRYDRRDVGPCDVKLSSMGQWCIRQGGKGQYGKGQCGIRQCGMGKYGKRQCSIGQCSLEQCGMRQPSQVENETEAHVYENPVILKAKQSRIPCALSILSTLMCGVVLILTAYVLFIYEPSYNECKRDVRETTCNTSKLCMTQFIKSGSLQDNRSSDHSFHVMDSAIRFTPVSAHIALLAPIANIDGHFYARFNTSLNESVAEHVRNVKVRETSLKIQYTGLFYIYCSLYHKANSRTGPQNLFYSILRKSYNNPADTGTLLQGVHNHSGTSHRHSGTTYIGGVFKLIAGDIIQVCLSNHESVIFTDKSSFLGLFMLGNI